MNNEIFDYLIYQWLIGTVSVKILEVLLFLIVSSKEKSIVLVKEWKLNSFIVIWQGKLTLKNQRKALFFGDYCSLKQKRKKKQKF